MTGSPGCGKSAVLGRIVAMSDPSYRRKLLREPAAAGAGVPPRLVDVGVHARHKLLPAIVQHIASGLGIDVDGPGQLLREISVRGRQGGRPIVIVLDALDEAGSGTAADAGGKGEPRRVARELLRPLSEVPGVRLLVGTRSELVGSLGVSMQVLNLDDPRYLGRDDIAGYVTNVLLAGDEPEVPTPYRDRAELARHVGEAVAGRAAGVFLVARMAARGLRSMDSPVDVTRPGWQDRLPSEIGQAFEDYLTWFGPDEGRVRALLTPLAFAEGQGLPRGALWTGMATALSNRPCGEADVDWLLEKAAAYIAEVVDDGRSVYRLYHQALAEHLRERHRWGSTAAQGRIVDALLATVPRDSGGNSDWFVAHRYLHAHLATHAAAAAGRLDELVDDPSFLLAAEQLPLLKALPEVRSSRARQTRSAYEQVAHQLMSSVPLAERAAYLQLSGRRCGATELADGVDRLDLPMPWRTRWAWWSPTGAHRQLVGHEKPITSLATGDMDGRPIVLTGSDDGTARIWDLITQRPIGEPLRLGSRSITALAVGELGDYTIALIGGSDGRLRMWDLSAGRPLGPNLDGHTNKITSIVLGGWDGQTLAVTASRDGSARVWDLEAGTQVGEPFTDHHRPVNAVAWTDVAGQRLVLTGGDDHRFRIWDIATSRALGEPLIGHTKPVTAVAIARLKHRQLVVTGSKDGTLGLWDLSTRQQVGEPLAAHQQGVASLAVSELNGVPIAVSCGQYQTLVRLWNLGSRQQIGQPLAGHDRNVNAVVIGSVDRRPVAITGGTDGTARIWDLTADQPLTGHTGPVASIAMARVDDRCLALTGSEDTTAVLWDLDSGGTQDGQPLSGHHATVTAVALGTVGRRSVAVTGDEDATVQVWDLASRERIGSPLTGHTGPIGAAHLCQIDGDFVLVTGSKDGTVRLWDPLAGKLLRPPLTGHNGNLDLLAVFDTDGRSLVLAGALQGHATVWELPSGRRLQIEQPDLDQWRAVAVGSADGRAVALFAGTDNTLLLWDLLNGDTIGSPMVGHTDPIVAAVLGARDGRSVAVTGSDDGVVLAWDLHISEPLGHSFVSGRYWRRTLAVGPLDGGMAVITVGDDQLRLWSLATFYQLGDAIHGHLTDISNLVAGTVDGRHILLAAGKDGTVRIFNASSGNLDGAVLNGHERFLGGAGFVEAKGPVAVTTGQFDSMVRVWDLTTRRQRSQWARRETARRAYSDVRLVAMSRRKSAPIVATAAGSIVQIWDLITQALLAELTGHTGRIVTVTAAELDGLPILLTTSVDSTARLWDLNALEALDPPLSGHNGSADATLSAFDNRALVFTGDSAGVVRAWDPVTRKEVSTSVPRLDKWVSSLAAGQLYGQPVLVIGGADGTLRIWCHRTAKIVAQAQLNTTPQDVVVDPSGDIYVATGMGIVALHIRNWTEAATQ